MTATLIREDGREEDVFSLIGPKKYDVPWRELETKGWIAEATCAEIRVAMPEPLRMEYAVAEWRNKYRIASENPAKDDVVACLLDRYPDSRVLIIGQYLKQLRQLRKRFKERKAFLESARLFDSLPKISFDLGPAQLAA